MQGAGFWNCLLCCAVQFGLLPAVPPMAVQGEAGMQDQILSVEDSAMEEWRRGNRPGG
jgi:hypothetical protein